VYSDCDPVYMFCDRAAHLVEMAAQEMSWSMRYQEFDESPRERVNAFGWPDAGVQEVRCSTLSHRSCAVARWSRGNSRASSLVELEHNGCADN
jgi:hypothetical protein